MALAPEPRPTSSSVPLYYVSDPRIKSSHSDLAGLGLQPITKFSLPKDDVYELQRMPARLMIPLVRSKWHLGSVILLCHQSQHSSVDPKNDPEQQMIKDACCNELGRSAAGSSLSMAHGDYTCWWEFEQLPPVMHFQMSECQEEHRRSHMSGCCPNWSCRSIQKLFQIGILMFVNLLVCSIHVTYVTYRASSYIPGNHPHFHGAIISHILVQMLLEHGQTPAYNNAAGHDIVINHQTVVREIDFTFMKEYGATWRLGGHLRTDVLMTADPKAMQHIFHKSAYNYIKRRDLDQVARNFLGPGIVAAPDNITDSDIGLKMCNKWKKEVLDTSLGPPWTSSELVGKWYWLGILMAHALCCDAKAAFDYDYGTLDNKENKLAKVYGNILCILHINHRRVQDILTPSNYKQGHSNTHSEWELFYRTMWNYLPDSLLSFVSYTPTSQYRRIRGTYHVLTRIVGKVLEEKIKDVSNKGDNQRDVMSVLIRANLLENPETQLEEEEMMAQMLTLTFAGHETTANTMSWMFWELAKNPDYQARMRDKIRAVHAAVMARGDDCFTINNLDSMTTVMNTIKETLRVHPIVYNLQCVAITDNVIPLSEPIISATGEVIDTIPVKAGQWIYASVCGYNRLPSVWGQDADDWNPDRFLTINLMKQVRVGVFAKLCKPADSIRNMSQLRGRKMSENVMLASPCLIVMCPRSDCVCLIWFWLYTHDLASSALARLGFAAMSGLRCQLGTADTSWSSVADMLKPQLEPVFQ
ncbi:cytochrome P450 [Fomes fomentarius]|nr:cytochrome P450 [Fomes fomentarius]